jgi:two-component system OmpR family response regulator
MARVLVIEDQESVVAIVRYHFENAGFDGVFTGDVADGWQQLVAERPDAAVVDIKLPGADGWTFIERLRADGRFSTLPIVVLTGLLEPEVVERAARLGCEYLGKPFAATTLMTKIRKLLDEDSAETARRALGGGAVPRIDLVPYEVSLLTDGYRIDGTVHLPPELARFSDGWEGLMRDNRHFVPVTNAIVTTNDGAQVAAPTFLEVRKDEIQAVFQVDQEPGGRQKPT